jgi:hypothetical protein
MIIYDFNSNEAMDNIDWKSVAWSGVQGANPFSVPGGKWGQAALYVVSDISINYMNGNYDGLSGQALSEAITTDALVGLGTSITTGEIGKRLKPHMRKLAQYLADKADLSPKVIKRITGKWATKTNPTSPKGAKMEGDVANFLDDEFGEGTVKNMGVEYAGVNRTIAGEIDVEGYGYNIEIKSGKVQASKVKNSYEITMNQNKAHILYAPKIKKDHMKNLKQEFPNITIVRNKSELKQAVQNLQKRP